MDSHTFFLPVKLMAAPTATKVASVPELVKTDSIELEALCDNRSQPLLQRRSPSKVPSVIQGSGDGIFDGVAAMS
jgi:hypothetical protein